MMRSLLLVLLSGLLACGDNPTNDGADAVNDTSAADTTSDTAVNDAAIDTESDARISDAQDDAEDDAATADATEDANEGDAVSVDVGDDGVDDTGEDAGEDAIEPDVETDAELDAEADVETDVGEGEVVIDADGNEYRTVRIGDQVWMAENLKVTRLNDGTPIGLYTFGMDWSPAEPVPLYQWADTSDLGNNFDEELPEDFYGAQYNAASLASGRLAPEGWRIPTVADFEELRAFLISEGHDGRISTVLREPTAWPRLSPGTDEYGFAALPNGYVHAFGGATGAPVISSMATSDVQPAEQTRTIMQLFESEEFVFLDVGMRLGAGVRLIRAD